MTPARDISVSNASRLNLDIIAISQHSTCDRNLSFHGHSHDDEPSGCRIHLDHARAVAQTEPASSGGTFLDHFPTESYLSRRRPGADRKNVFRRALWGLTEDCSSRLPTTGSQEQINPRKTNE